MIVRSLIVSGIMAAVGAGILVRGSAKAYKVDETWLERQYPSSLGRYTMEPARDGSTGHSYTMDSETYKTLKPYGIVGRVLTDGQKRMDVVTLAGDSEESFHNPLLCFQAQGWETKDIQQITLRTKAHGEVRATVAEAIHEGGAPQYAVYTFEGPDGMVADPYQLKIDMFNSAIRTGKVQFGTFFRFISMTPSFTKDEVIKFATDYLETCPTRPIEKLGA